MNEKRQRHEMTLKPVLFQLEGTADVVVEPNIEYSDDNPAYQCFDLYRPGGSDASATLPAVVFVSGYRDRGAETFIGCRLKDMQAYIDWGRLVAASGLIGIAYSNVEPGDVNDLLSYLRAHGNEHGVDADRIGIWACSGNVPNALSLLTDGTRLACAVLAYGYMFGGDDPDVVARANEIGFAYPIANKSADDLTRDVPLLVARAGRDEYDGLNASIDRFAADALRLNLELTLINHADGQHAFDLQDDTTRTREVIAEILAYLKRHLAATAETR